MWIKRLFLFIWAYIPIFALTDDLSFLAANKGATQHEYYFSIISILFGEKKIQFFSFPIKQPGKKMIWFRIKKLSDMDAFNLTTVKANQLKIGYTKHYDELSTDIDKDIEKEALLRHLSDEQSRVDVSYNKINAFTTIIVTVIPIAIALVNWDTIFSLNLFGIFIVVWLIYANINLCAWIFQAINVRGFMASTFGDLKKSTEKQKEQTWQIYYDWQQSKRKADMYVSFVMNTKIWIITVIILTIIFSVFLPFSKKSVIVPSGEDNVYTLDVNLIESTYDKSAADWYLILAKLQTDKYSQVVVLYNKVSDADVANKLNEFQNQKIIWMSDPDEFKLSGPTLFTKSTEASDPDAFVMGNPTYLTHAVEESDPDEFQLYGPTLYETNTIETSDPDEFRLSEELSKNSNILMSQTRHTYTVETSDEDEFLLM